MELPEDVKLKLGNKSLGEITAKVKYKNWKGETAVRKIIPLSVFYGSTEYHKQEQWLMKVWDLEKGDYRTYALKDIQIWIK